MAERTKWTPEMVDRLHELWNRNWTPLEIAQEMGLPFEVIKSKISNEKTKAKKAEKGFTFKLNPEPDPTEEPEPNTPPFSEPETTATEQPEPLLTKAEAASIADFIDFYLFDAIRADKDADNTLWLVNIVRALDKLCAYSGYKLGGEPDKEEQNAE